MAHSTSLTRLITLELTQDAFDDDVTTALLGERGDEAALAIVRSREAGIFSGIAVIDAFHKILGDAVCFDLRVGEGEAFGAGADLLSFRASFGLCLSLERTLLNFLSHACGVATLTRSFVGQVGTSSTKIVPTRKTLPGLREVQLLAVAAGGGLVHRRSLSDGILIKENHQALLSSEALLNRAHALRSPVHGIEIEVQDVADLPRVIAGRPDVIMLDNLSVEKMRGAIQEIRDKLPSCRIEASGGMSLERISEVAALGVDYISVGALTHSARSLDLGLDIDRAAT